MQEIDACLVRWLRVRGSAYVTPASAFIYVTAAGVERPCLNSVETQSNHRYPHCSCNVLVSNRPENHAPCLNCRFARFITTLGTVMISV